jgi:hypothetical protein
MLLTVRTLDGHALDVEVDAAGGIQPETAIGSSCRRYLFINRLVMKCT